MVVRDRVVRWVLACGALAALLAWHFVGAWPAMAIVLLTLIGASIAYRIEPPKIDLHGSPWIDDAADRDRSRSSVVDQ